MTVLDIQDAEYIHLQAFYIPRTLTSEVIFNELVPTEIRSVQMSRKLYKKNPTRLSHILKSCKGKKFVLTIFSPPDLKAQVSFSDRLLFIVRLSVHLYANFSQSNLLCKNHWANFNQTWHKICQVLPSYLRKSTNTMTKFVKLHLKNQWANFNQTWHRASLSQADLRL